MVIKRADLQDATHILGVAARHMLEPDKSDALMLRDALGDVQRGKGQMTVRDVGRVAYLLRLVQVNANDIMAERARQLAEIFEAQLG